jgi:hypothetical protein
MASSIITEPKRTSTNGDIASMAASGVINLSNASGESIEELTKEVELLKQKLEEERAKFNDVECKTFKILILLLA